MPKYRVFADETCINHPRMAIGGIWLDTTIEKSVRGALIALRTEFKAIYKWENLAPAKLPYYRRLLETFFDFDERLTFNAIVICREDADLPGAVGIDAQMLVYIKRYFYLLSRRSNPGSTYFVRTDPHTRVSDDDWQDLKVYVNRYCSSLPGYHPNTIEELFTQRVYKDDLNQMADVLLGAVGADINGAAKSWHKREFVNQMIYSTPLRCLTSNSPASYSKVNIWRWRERTEPPR